MQRLLADTVGVARGFSLVLQAQAAEYIRMKPDAILRYFLASPVSVSSATPPSTPSHSSSFSRQQSTPAPSATSTDAQPHVHPASTQTSPHKAHEETTKNQSRNQSHAVAAQHPPSSTLSENPIQNNVRVPNLPASIAAASGLQHPVRQENDPGPTTPAPEQEQEKETTRSSARWQALERRVPESPLARVLNFGALGAGLVAGAAAESLRRAVGLSSPTMSDESTTGRKSSYSAFVSDANAQRLASSLSRMRGAALKLGQMLSIQDDRLIPAPLQQALERVRQGADIMPRRQLVQVLKEQYGGPDDDTENAWMSRLNVVDFDYEPIAAASIGQVHVGYRLSDDKVTRTKLAFKVQYPGVARSIASDISNLKRLISATGLVPDKFYVDQALAAAKEELERECDYELEAKNQTRFRNLIMQSNLATDFYVPQVVSELSTKAILASEFVNGIAIDQVTGKAQKSWIASNLLRLTLAELFEFRFMQTDPNFANFLFGHENGRDRLYLVDFGAAREYDAAFVETYFDLICACADRDRNAIIEHSITLGFLTGEESKVMLDAHYAASVAVGEPFSAEHAGGYNFEKNDIPARTAQFGKTMLEHRLTPPPKEAYSLHRRLSGAFLTAMKLGATIDCTAMLNDMRTKIHGFREKNTKDFAMKADVAISPRLLGQQSM